MAKQTFTTRRNKPARRKKEQKKQARMIEQDSKKAAAGTFEDEKSKTAGFALRLVPGGKPRYFTSSVRPRDPKRKSEITLHATRKRETLSAPSATTQILPSERNGH
jgi:putative intracellular protease/amidase